MRLKCTDDHRIFDKKGKKQTDVFYENDEYEVNDTLGEELLSTGNFVKVEEEE